MVEILRSQTSCVTGGRQGTGSVSRKIFSLQYSLEIPRPANLIPGTSPGCRIPDSRDDFSSRSRMKKIGSPGFQIFQNFNLSSGDQF